MQSVKTKWRFGLVILAICFGTAVLAAPGGNGGGKPPKDDPPPDLVESPDLAIAFTCGGLVLSSPDGTEQNLVLPNPPEGGIAQPTWSPDGDAIVFVMAQDSGHGLYLLPIDPAIGQAVGDPLWIVDVDHSDRITYPVWSPTAAPNGEELIAYQNAYDELLLVNPNWNGNLANPAVTPGLPIAVADIAPPLDPGHLQLGATWSPAADRLAISLTDDDISFSHVEILDLGADSSGSLTVVDRNVIADIAIDDWSSYMAWSKREETATIAVPLFWYDSIYLVPVVEGSGPITILSEGETWRFLEWSPDDSQVVVNINRWGPIFKGQKLKGYTGGVVLFDLDLSAQPPVLTERNVVAACNGGRPSWRSLLEETR